MKFVRLISVIILVVGLVNYFRPLPAAQPTIDFQTQIAGSVPKISWPEKGQTAIGAVGYGVLDATPTDQSVPTASIAKIITALTVLQKYPLAIGETGPTLTLSKTDIADYNKYLTEDGSAVPVEVGEKISEYQALEAMLIPSANNIADTLARWAFGSIANYSHTANQLVKSLGANHTEITSASGFPPSTMSTASDLVLLGEAALNNPVIADIVSKKTAVVPVAGVIQNTNHLLGSNGIDGIKTGNTDEARGCFLFSSRQVIGGQNITIVGAVLGAPDVPTAFNDSLPLIKSATNGFGVQTINQGQVVGHYQLAWGKTVDVVAGQELKIISWPNLAPPVNFHLQSLGSNAVADKQVGSATATVGNETSSIPLNLQSSEPGPSWNWRLLR